MLQQSIALNTLAESGLVPIEPQVVLDELGLKCNVFLLSTGVEMQSLKKRPARG